MNHTKIAVLTAAGAVFALPVFAQSAPNTPSAPATGESIQDRKENQQDRIANGVKSGQLTAGETTNLEKKQSNLNQEERDMRKLDNGHLTNADKATLNQQQNQLSKQIYKETNLAPSMRIAAARPNGASAASASATSSLSRALAAGDAEHARPWSPCRPRHPCRSVCRPAPDRLRDREDRRRSGRPRRPPLP